MGFFSKTKDFKILEQINSKSSVKRHIKFVLGCFIIAVSNGKLIPVSEARKLEAKK